MNIVVLHGPNLNLLGERPSDEDPKLTLDALNKKLREKARVLEVSLRIYQTNHEGGLIDHLHNERKWADAFLINPGAFAHYSYALRDAIAAVAKPTIEVHLTDLSKREAFRKISVLTDVVQERIIGKGLEGYMEALEVLDQTAQTPKPKGAEPLRALPKTLGRAKASESNEETTVGGRASKKSIGKKNEVSAPSKRERAGNLISRAVVRQKIADRLAGRVTPSALSTWARSHWSEVQGGAPTEAGQREVLEDTLQQLMLASQPSARLSDDQLVELMTQLE